MGICDLNDRMTLLRSSPVQAHHGQGRNAPAREQHLENLKRASRTKVIGAGCVVRERVDWHAQQAPCQRSGSAVRKATIPRTAPVAR